MIIIDDFYDVINNDLILFSFDKDYETTNYMIIDDIKSLISISLRRLLLDTLSSNAIRTP